MPRGEPCDRTRCKGDMHVWCTANEADGTREFLVCDLDSRHIADRLVGPDERQQLLPGMEE